jgi:hypothetical protein
MLLHLFLEFIKKIRCHGIFFIVKSCIKSTILSCGLFFMSFKKTVAVVSIQEPHFTPTFGRLSNVQSFMAIVHVAFSRLVNS